ncbi:hypothetical protein RHOFW104T7_10220 [Rhodanobacter thiooxydans]|uniref:Transmembrane protein n=1 Tax=Rhodanobacter thiooxydans TaxID=416169 RepID=A0A154QK33_9GAMM|nr:hypothetical protein [Rhodanobacter thiooxydans]EIL97446.1 putative transmembrane protein [Rhodanobacter thiooxydans LCS2]KZC24087.1 hypothetical protein RHOFW104T7_10220 [Rhodanobacter thiooxydans]MCW0201893.1 hypothetical protein [Rhodanobacter thiooxydans]
MSTAERQRLAPAFAVALFVALLLPPVRAWLESRMSLQMLVQIPLLITVGWLLSAALPPRLGEGIARWNRHGISSLVLASLAGMFWMLPRSLDAAIGEPWMAVAKFASVPLLIGLPLGLGWPHMGFVVRGVFLLELTATFFRLGWLYLVSPIRLCNNYLLDDQQRAGEAMLVIGSLLLAGVAIKLLWGRFDST